MPDAANTQSRAALWVSAIAFVVSILSFLAATAQAWFMYEHNRVSVLPKLDWRVVYADAAGPRFDVVLINAGLGPAKVSDLKISVDGAIYGMADGMACDQIDTLLGVTPQHGDQSDCFSIDQEDWTYVRPNERLVLYTTGPGKTLKTDAFPTIGVSAQSCSLYNQCEDL